MNPDLIREFVIAGHGNLSQVQALLAEHPALLNTPWQWGEGDFETAIQAAAHVGNRPIAEFLLSQGAPLELCTAAMLGRHAEVQAMLQAGAEAASAHGAHRIPLLPHAALSGDPAMLALVTAHGATTGASQALSLALSRRLTEAARWLLAHAQPDLTWQNFQGQTAWQVAAATDQTALLAEFARPPADSQ